MKILAVDPGTATGYALDGRSGVRDLSPATAAPTKGRLAEPEFSRCGKLWALLDELADPAAIHAVVCEGAAGFTKGKHAVRVSNELRGVVKAWCWTRGARYVEIAPTDLQRSVTGRGQVPKEEMVAAARERFGYAGDSDDEADALHILEWARVHVAREAPRVGADGEVA